LQHALLLQRSILVNKPELGYGAKGIQELPPNTTFELKVEILNVYPKKT
jgi:FKBP-type peptidyl-prolyl cis-trans isomerase